MFRFVLEDDRIIFTFLDNLVAFEVIDFFVNEDR
jgi:hypothetical protein